MVSEGVSSRQQTDTHRAVCNRASRRRSGSVGAAVVVVVVALECAVNNKSASAPAAARCDMGWLRSVDSRPHLRRLSGSTSTSFCSLPDLLVACRL